MAMTTCRECGHAVSTEAAACPGCGISPKPPLAVPAPRYRNETSWGKSFLILFLLAGAAYWFFPFASGDSDREAAVAAGPMETTPAELEQAYEANTVAADARFKGKDLIVSGNVASIDTDFQNKVYLTLLGSNQFMHTQAHMNEASRPMAGALRRGAFVSVHCVGNGDIMNTPMLRDCEFVVTRH